jgi:hypothetical protein
MLMDCHHRALTATVNKKTLKQASNRQGNHHGVPAMNCHFPLAAVLVLVWTTAARAQPQPLDLIPADAAAALVFHDPDALKAKGDKLFEEAGIQNPGLRPSQLVSLALQFLGVNAGFDGKGSAGAFLTGRENIVVFLPYTDLDQMAGNFGLKKGELVPDKVTASKGAAAFGKFLLARGKHLFIADKEGAFSAITKAKSVKSELAPAQQKSLAGADILVHLGTNAWADEWKNSLKDFKKQFGRREEPAEQKVVDQFVEALGDMRFGIGGVRVERGVGLSFMPVFKKDGAARELLTALAGRKGGSDLTGLPDGNVVFAQALRGGNAGNAVVAKVLFDILFRHFLETRDLLSALDRPVVVGFLTEIMNRLEGSRAALYLTSDEPRLGLFSLVAILDADDPAKFLADMKVLARIADGSGLALNQGSTSPERIDVNQLIRDLGNVKFRVRESATLKLRLLAEPALPYLEKARASGDLEVSRRATRLRDQIVQAAALRRKNLLEQDWLHRLQPSFALIPGAEKRRGHDVHVVRIKLTDKDKIAENPLRQVFGPEWHNVRLTIHGRKVVVLLGSETALLDAALRNLDEAKPGLAAAAAFKTFASLGNPERRLELHLSMHRILGLIMSGAGFEGLKAKDGGLTSLAVSLDPDRVRLDVWIPAAEFRVLGKRFPF